MAVEKHDALIKKLKKQVLMLKRREEKSRTHVKSTIKKAQKLGQVYKKKLAKKVQDMKSRIAHVEAAAYMKAAADIERHLMKTLHSKNKLLTTVIAKIEKTHAAHLIKCFAATRRKSKKTTKTSKG